MTDPLKEDLPQDLRYFDLEWRHGSRERAKAIAVSYVDANPELAEKLGGYSREQLIALSSAYRRKEREADRLKVDMYLLARVEPVDLYGVLNIDGDSLAIAAAEAILREARR